MTAPRRGRGRPRKAEELVVEETVESAEPVQTAEDLEIAALKAELEQLRSEKAKRDEEALKPSPNKLPDENDDYVVIHFLRDGFTAFGTIWLQGQEIRIKRGGSKWQETVNINGESWLDLDEDAQFAKYKKVFFRRGPATRAALGDIEIVERDIVVSSADKYLARVIMD